jgi:GDPmannose 4,6-dehydratase
MVAADKEEAAKEALLRRKGFAVVGSMENPPFNAGSAIAIAASKGGEA